MYTLIAYGHNGCWYEVHAVDGGCKVTMAWVVGLANVGYNAIKLYGLIVPKDCHNLCQSGVESNCLALKKRGKETLT